MVCNAYGYSTIIKIGGIITILRCELYSRFTSYQDKFYKSLTEFFVPHAGWGSRYKIFLGL